MKYCSTCGQPVEQRIPEGDNRHRYVCVSCETIHYQNPRIVAGTVPVWEGQILLCKRAIEPRYGYWTLPAGFMENAETTMEAAARETREEALAEVSFIAPPLQTGNSAPGKSPWNQSCSLPTISPGTKFPFLPYEKPLSCSSTI